MILGYLWASCFSTLFKRLSLLKHIQSIPDRPNQAKKQKRNPFFQVLEHGINQALSKQERIAQSTFWVTRKNKMVRKSASRILHNSFSLPTPWQGLKKKRIISLPRQPKNRGTEGKHWSNSEEIVMHSIPVNNFAISHSFGYYNNQTQPFSLCHLQAVSVVLWYLPKGSGISYRAPLQQRKSLRASRKEQYHILWTINTLKYGLLGKDF